MWFIHLESVKLNLNGNSGRQSAIVNVSNLRFLLRYEVIRNEWVAVHQKDVCFLLILFYWPFPVINLRIAKNTWDNGWLLFKALVYCTVSVGKCFSYFGSFVLPRERIFPMCFAPEVICCFSMYAHKQLLPLCLNTESAVPSDEAITRACHVYLHRSASQST